VTNSRGRVGDGVRFLVEISLDWCETHQRGLASLHHGEPDQENPQGEKGHRGMIVVGKRRLTREDQTVDKGNGEKQHGDGEDSFGSSESVGHVDVFSTG